MLSCKTNLFSHSCPLKCCSQGVASFPVHRFDKSVMYLLSLSSHHNICTPLHHCCPYRQLNAVLLFPVLNKPLSHVSFFFSCGQEIDLTDENVSWHTHCLTWHLTSILIDLERDFIYIGLPFAVQKFAKANLLQKHEI